MVMNQRKRVEKVKEKYGQASLKLADETPRKALPSEAWLTFRVETIITCQEPCGSERDHSRRQCVTLPSSGVFQHGARIIVFIICWLYGLRKIS